MESKLFPEIVFLVDELLRDSMLIAWVLEFAVLPDMVLNEDDELLDKI